MLTARSAEECHLYMELHPCDCGEPVFQWSRCRREQRDDRPFSVYEGHCGACGEARCFEFAVTDEPPPPPAYGGPEPSQIIGPDEFLAVAQALAAIVPADPQRLGSEEREQAMEVIELASAAIDEVLKFAPEPDGEALPARLRSELAQLRRGYTAVRA